MKLYHIRQTQLLPVTPREAWIFFSDPRNLQEITPPSLHFTIRSVVQDREIYPGQMIHYRIRILPFLPVSWLTEITHVRPPEFFVDDQRIGPYALWHHQHHFRQAAGGTEMIDEVIYALPLGWIGRLMHAIFVGPRLNTIFAYRQRLLAKKFSAKSEQLTHV